jgi:thiol-disulfide isomerase/thioredoxin
VRDQETDRQLPAPRRRRRWGIDLALVVVVFIAVQLYVTRDVVRGPLPPLEGMLADGSATAVDRWQRAQGGDAFLLYVWATWCPICKTVEGSIDSVARDAPVLTVAMQSGGGAEVGRFLVERGYRWPTLVDDDGRLSRQLGVGAVPTLIFVDRAGEVRAVTRGYTSELGIRLRLWWAGRFGYPRYDKTVTAGVMPSFLARLANLRSSNVATLSQVL